MRNITSKVHYIQYTGHTVGVTGSQFLGDMISVWQQCRAEYNTSIQIWLAMYRKCCVADVSNQKLIMIGQMVQNGQWLAVIMYSVLHCVTSWISHTLYPHTCDYMITLKAWGPGTTLGATYSTHRHTHAHTDTHNTTYTHHNACTQTWQLTIHINKNM